MTEPWVPIDFARVRREVPLRSFVQSLGKTLQQDASAARVRSSAVQLSLILISSSEIGSANGVKFWGFISVP